MTRQEIISKIKEKGIKTKIVGATNQQLLEALNSETKAVDNFQNKAILQSQNKKLIKDDRFVVVQFLKSFTPYKKGDTVNLEKTRYNFIIKKDKSVLKLI